MFKKIILSLSSILFILLLFELGFRLIPALRSKYQFSRYVLKERGDIYSVEAINESFYRSGQYLYRPSEIPGLGYELVPHMQAEREVNSYGMVCKEYPINKRTNIYRILVLGDSITQDYNFVESLEEMLNDASSNLVFELWNAGVGGYQVNQYAAYLKYKGIRYKPDMVIVNFGLNDFDLNAVVYYETKDGVVGYRNAGYHLSKMIPLNKWYYKHSYLYRFLIINLENSFFGAKNQYANFSVNKLREGRYYIKLIKNICENRKISPLAVIFPYLKPLKEYTDGERKQYKMIFNSLSALDIEFIDLHEYMPEEERYMFKCNKQDYVHATPEGYRLEAKAVFKYLSENQFKEILMKKQ